MAGLALIYITAALLLVLCSLVESKTIEHDFTVGWVTANPDGRFDRPTIGVNGAWPLPLITATVGDHLKLSLHNDLGNASTSLHFHGFFQNGTNYMDGAVGVTQCAIPPGSSFTYEFEVRMNLLEEKESIFFDAELVPTSWHVLVPCTQRRAVSRGSAWPRRCA